MLYSLKHFGSLWNALEIKSRFALTLHYKRLSSRNTEEFSLQFQKLYPGEIHNRQTDNGNRKPRGLPPVSQKSRHAPRVFLSPVPEDECPPNEELFNIKLAEYLIFYNTKRVHKGLGNTTIPTHYLINQAVLSQECSTCIRD